MTTIMPALTFSSLSAILSPGRVSRVLFAAGVLAAGALTAAAAALTIGAGPAPVLESTTPTASPLTGANDVPTATPETRPVDGALSPLAGQRLQRTMPTAEPSTPAAQQTPIHPATGESTEARGPIRTQYEWPTRTEVPVLRPFSAPTNRWEPGHRGVDLRAGANAPVIAPADGVIAFRGVVAGRPVISIDHPDGTRTSYEPVDSPLSPGQRVVRSDVVGMLTADPRPVEEQPHAPGILHWGARVRAAGTPASAWEYIDPLTLLDPPVIRLLPLNGY